MKFSLKIGQSIVFFAYVAQVIMGACWLLGNVRGDVTQIAFALIRLSLAYFAGVCFLGEYMNRYYRGTQLTHCTFIKNFGSLAFITIPQCMQMHVTLPEESYAVSLFLLIISSYLRLHELKYVEEERKINKGVQRITMFLLWFFLGMLKPLYAVLTLYFIFAELYHMWKVEGNRLVTDVHRKRRVIFTVVFVIEGILLLFFFKVNFLTLERSLAESMVSRFSYVRIEKDYEMFPKDIHDAVGLSNTRAAGFESDGISEVLVPVLEEQYTYKEVNEALWRIASIGYQNHKKENFKEIVWDLLGYQLPQSVVPMQLTGRGYESKTGQNYYRLTKYTPILGKACVNAGKGLSIIFMLAGVSGLVYAAVIGRKGIHLRRLFVVIIIAAEVIVVINSLKGAGMMDYRLSALSTIFWYTPGILLLALAQEQNPGGISKN